MMDGGISFNALGEYSMRRILIAVILIPNLVFSMTTDEITAAHNENVKELEKMGLITPDSGIKIVPRDEMHMNALQMKKDFKETKELKTKGYISKDSKRAYELLHFDDVISKNSALEAKMYKATDAHLRSSPEDMIFAYNYVGVPKNQILQYVGIAPAGTYVKTPKAGWSGAVEFFRSNFAFCSYLENNLHISHGAAVIIKEDAEHLVNNKVTLLDVEGSESSGFLYTVKWFSNDFIRTLECANDKFSKDITQKTIALATSIDRAP
jgi:hypothetical protein